MKHNLLKSVIISVILLMGVSNVWGEVVLRYQKDMPSGNYDGNTSQTMTQSSANSNRYYCEISLTANSSYGFFIINGSNYYKVNVTATSNNSVQLYDYGSSNYGNSNHRVTYKTGTAGIYIFTYDASNHKICVSPKSSETIKIAYDVAQGHDGDWNLNNYVNLTQVGSTANYTIDLDLQAKKYYMFVQISNSIYWRAGSTLDVDGFASLYYYGTTNYGNSGDKINFTPSTAGKYRFTWNHQDKTIKLEPFYSVIYNGNSHTSGSVPTTSLHLKGSTVTVASNSGNLARTGYTFGGWNTNSTGTGTNYTAGSGSFTMGSSNTTLYANWKENKYSVDISTDGNGTTNQTGTKSIGIVGISITATPKIGSAFKQWEVTGGAKVANATSATTTITATSAGTVKAVFEEKPATTIYLEPTGHWNSDKAVFQAHVWQTGKTGVNLDMVGIGDPSHADGDNKSPYRYYKVEVPYGYDKILFFREDPANKTTIWNQTADLAIPTDTKTLYEILSTGEGTSTKATGVWKEANLVYTITLGSSMFGPYGIKYNGQSYFSKDNVDVIVNVPYGATITFIEGQPYSDIYTGDIMEKDVVRKFDLTQPYTVLRDVKFESNYVTKVPMTIYLGVPNNLDTDDNPNNSWDKDESYANLIWRYDSQGSFMMYDNLDMGEEVFEANGVKYYKFTLQPGCNKFQFQRKDKSTHQDLHNASTKYAETLFYIYEVLNTDVNCYMLDGGMYGDQHTGYWCELPPAEGDYRLLYIEQKVEKKDWKTVITRTKAHPSNIIREGTDSQIVSLYINAEGNHPEVILQQYDGTKWINQERHMVLGPLTADAGMAMLPGRRNAANENILIYDDGIEVIKNDVNNHKYKGSGVWNFTVVQDGSSAHLDLTANGLKRYTGEYYIRCNAAFGEWNSYKGSDNHMTRSDVSMQNSNYSHYYCKWIKDAGTNVKFTVANDYGHSISDTLTADMTDMWGTEIADNQKMVTGETLPASANVRFTWNEKTNLLHRAYIAGSSNVSDRFLVLQGDAKLFNISGGALTEGTAGSDRYGLKANEEIFKDNSNWVYYTDVRMKPNAPIKVTAKYNNKVQYFIGTAENSENIFAGTNSDNKYKIRLTYDFKTNKLAAAYIPDGEGVLDAIAPSIMLIREGHGEASQLQFTGELNEELDVWGVIEFKMSDLREPANAFSHSLYWISFPFNVTLNKVVSFGEYGKHWIIETYNGAKRAEEGLWIDSESNWEFEWDQNIELKANTGYIVALDIDQIKADYSHVNDKDKIGIYFPANTTITKGFMEKQSHTTTADEHLCKINRNTLDGDRRIKDSNWNVIGVPSFANAVGVFGDHPYDDEWYEGKTFTKSTLPYLYEWIPATNKYTARSGKDYTFQSMHAYMVQYAGDITWTNVIVENIPASIAARKNTDYEAVEHNLRLELQHNETKVDHTYITLQEDNVTPAFDFNYDLCKVINSGANIYTLIDTETDPIEVAANVMPIANTVIPVGVQVATAGEYTFAMPDGTDGIVVELIDYETNTTTNLMLDEYTVNLAAGTNESRFALSVKPDKTATSLEDININSNGVKKYLIDGVLYLQKDGLLYDAQGKLVR